MGVHKNGGHFKWPKIICCLLVLSVLNNVNGYSVPYQENNFNLDDNLFSQFEDLDSNNRQPQVPVASRGNNDFLGGGFPSFDTSSFDSLFNPDDQRPQLSPYDFTNPYPTPAPNPRGHHPVTQPTVRPGDRFEITLPTVTPNGRPRTVETTPNTTAPVPSQPGQDQQRSPIPTDDADRAVFQSVEHKSLAEIQAELRQAQQENAQLEQQRVSATAPQQMPPCESSDRSRCPAYMSPPMPDPHRIRQLEALIKRLMMMMEAKRLEPYYKEMMAINRQIQEIRQLCSSERSKSVTDHHGYKWVVIHNQWHQYSYQQFKQGFDQKLKMASLEALRWQRTLAGVARTSVASLIPVYERIMKVPNVLNKALLELHYEDCQPMNGCTAHGCHG